MGMHLGLAVEFGDAAAGSLRFRKAFGSVFLLEQHLPLQIAPFDIVAIDQRQCANPARARSPATAAPVAPQPTMATWAAKSSC